MLGNISDAGDAELHGFGGTFSRGGSQISLGSNPLGHAANPVGEGSWRFTCLALTQFKVRVRVHQAGEND